MSSSAKDDPTLFNQEENQWEKFERNVRLFKPKPVDAWQYLYNQWKTLYRSFRDLEEKSLYSVDNRGKTIKADEGTSRSHRQSLAYLVFTGEALATQLDQITNLVEAEEKEDAHQMKIRMGTMLESLRESVELWHPANKSECHDDLKGIFDD